MLVKRIMRRLRQEDFAILDWRKIPYGHQIRLGCGAAINVYSSGTVLIQGKLIESVRDESLALLKKILPTTTKWQVR